jgi:localization factor PodJL
MAEGGWPIPTGFLPEDERTVRALDDMRAILGRLEGRLAGGEADTLPASTVQSLIGALNALAERLARSESQSQGRIDQLLTALAALSARLDSEATGHAAALEALDAAQAVRDPGPVRAILVAAAALAALAVIGAVAVVAARPEALPAIVVEGLRIHRPALPLRPGLTPQELSASSVASVSGAPTAATVAPAPTDSYAAVQAALARGEANALPRLTGLADAGDPDAQLHLASLYETSKAGLPRDLAAARLWTRRAAGGGNRVAMHNLGLFLTEGDGGPRDVEEAAAWFRRAAERGVVDSQFNLGVLYESGRGVSRNLREAYRWFSIAANAGDLAAREKQVELEGRLSAAERAGLDRDSIAFQPGPVPPAARDPDPLVPPATTLVETQTLLARQGYYVGPADGVVTPQLRAAAAAYLRDHPELARRP